MTFNQKMQSELSAIADGTRIIETLAKPIKIVPNIIILAINIIILAINIIVTIIIHVLTNLESLPPGRR